ncbi:iron ABC transporter permease [Cellulomonas sp. PhB150]|uniref:FecCD family ABC transporter permease n=1 Tax=Cellulomonas sp. PhB150 TaxID=2485188 RepID=UPI000F4AB86E|nr:iron ABC transporter permease [Cellulomonas sp. PhB150]ROS28029.1 iron complex transport system permease protein [Cellulomonas sp. PhB150]
MAAASSLAVPVAARTRGGRPRGALLAGLLVALVLLAVVAFASVALGSRAITPATLLHAFTAFDPTSTDHTVIRDMRVPRTLLGLAVGAALGLSGALLQGVARNPLADPGIMGINAGAAVAIVLAVLLLGVQQASTYVWFAFAGAGVATVIVYGIASFGREGATPVKLALAGVAVTAAFSSITSAVLLTNVDALEQMRMWQVGALAGRYAPVLHQLAPYFVVGILAALLAGRALNGLALGDDVARALGQRVTLTRGVLFAVVALLCGAATAACGPIVFLGLVVPHVARIITGPDYRWLLAYAAVLGPLLLLACDIVGRLVVAPGELQVGVVIGLLGAPVFVALVRYRRMVEL